MNGIGSYLAIGLVASTLLSPATPTQAAPAGWTVTALVDHGGFDPQVSGARVVWSGWVDGTSGSEVFLFDGMTTRRLTHNSYADYRCRISDSYVAWQGYDGHDTEVFRYDGISVMQLTDNDGPDYNPDISDSYIVWKGGQSNAYWDLEVFLYDGNAVRQLTNNDHGDHAPRTEGRFVAWYGGTDGASSESASLEVFLYDGIGTMRLTTNTYRDAWPDVSSRFVAWEGDGAVYAYDCASQSTTKLADSGTRPSVSGEAVVWAGHEGSGSDYEVYLYDGVNVVQLTDDPYYDWHDLDPQVSGLNVVWRGWDGHDYEILVHSEGITTQLTDNETDDVNPQISGSNVVWEGSDGGIFLAAPIPDPGTLPPVANAGGPYTIILGESVALDAAQSTDPNHDIASHMWDLNDDGVFETDAAGEAMFLATGAYLESLSIGGGHHTISVLVTDGEGLNDTHETLLTIMIHGDANLNGFVDDTDLAILLANWEQDPRTITTWELGNFTQALGDFDVDDTDLSVLLGNWTGPPPAGAAVPEPATLSLLALGGLAVMRRRRR